MKTWLLSLCCVFTLLIAGCKSGAGSLDGQFEPELEDDAAQHDDDFEFQMDESFQSFQQTEPQVESQRDQEFGNEFAPLN